MNLVTCEHCKLAVFAFVKKCIWCEAPLVPVNETKEKVLTCKRCDYNNAEGRTFCARCLRPLGENHEVREM